MKKGKNRLEEEMTEGRYKEGKKEKIGGSRKEGRKDEEY